MEAPRRRTLDLPGAVLVALGGVLVGLSAFMLIAPGAFFEQVAPFGVRNDHFIRDGATFQLALGVLALIAAARPSLRLAAIAVIGVQFLLHALNHLADIGEASPQWLGVGNFAALVAGCLALLWIGLLERAHR